MEIRNANLQNDKDKDNYKQAKAHYENKNFREAIDCLHKIKKLDKKKYLQLGADIELHLQPQNSDKFQNLLINYFMFQGYETIDTEIINKIFIKQFCKHLQEVITNKEIYKMLVNGQNNFENFLEEFQLYFFEADVENFNNYLKDYFQVLSNIIEEASQNQGNEIQNLIILNNKNEHAIKLVNFVIELSKKVVLKRKLK